MEVKRAKLVSQITVSDPDTNEPVQLSLFKHEGGKMFAIASSFIEQCTDDDEAVMIADPFNNDSLVELESE